jgi:pilus assembly protein Flp/PilA
MIPRPIDRIIQGLTRQPFEPDPEVTMTNIIQTISAWIAARENDDEGATMVEYALMVALIAVVALAAVTLLGVNVTAKFQEIADALV